MRAINVNESKGDKAGHRFGLWLLLLSIAGYRLGGRHFPVPQRVIDIATLPCMGNPPYMAR